MLVAVVAVAGVVSWLTSPGHLLSATRVCLAFERTPAGKLFVRGRASRDWLCESWPWKSPECLCGFVEVFVELDTSDGRVWEGTGLFILSVSGGLVVVEGEGVLSSPHGEPGSTWSTAGGEGVCVGVALWVVTVCMTCDLLSEDEAGASFSSWWSGEDTSSGGGLVARA